MAWRRGRSYSEDLRARVLAAIDSGIAARSAASVFRVSVSYIYKALIRRRRTGEVSASTRRGHRPRKLTPAQWFLPALLCLRRNRSLPPPPPPCSRRSRAPRDR